MPGLKISDLTERITPPADAHEFELNEAGSSKRLTYANIKKGISFQFTFDSSISMTDPGSGLFRFNNAAPASATVIAIDALDANATDVSDFIADLNTNGGTIQFYQSDGAFFIGRITAVTDNTGWLELTVAHVDSGGTFLGLSSIIPVLFPSVDPDTLLADVDDTLNAGYATTIVNDGTKTTGTYTPGTAGGNMKRVVNGGAHTLGVPTAEGTIIIQYTNNVSAGVITTSAWTIVTGDSLTTVDGDDFMLYLTMNNAFDHLHITALQ